MQNEKLYEGFIFLIQENEKLIHKVCSFYSSDAEEKKDLFQEIVLQAWIAYPRFNHASKPGTWLYRVALNTAVNFTRRQKMQWRITNDILENFAADDSKIKEEHKVLHHLIHTLPALEKALMLLYLEEKTHQEISEIMGLSVSNVGTKIGRIKLKLKKQAISFFK